MCHIDEHEIGDVIKNLNNTHSKKFDGISSNTIKKCSAALRQNLITLINKSFDEGVFPDVLKQSKIIPIYKNGSKADTNNYRPIAISSPIAKIVESAFKRRLMYHLLANNILCNEQYGFRTSCNTTIALYDLCTRIQDNVYAKLKTAALFLDLQKAFDTVSVDLLLEKTKSIGIEGRASSWLESYLRNRKQYVHVNNADSDHLVISCGVPQGSILGPILFLIFINDFQQLPLMGKPHLFADDIALVYAACSDDVLESHLNTDLKINSSYLRRNKLCLNVKKTKYMNFQNSRDMEVFYDGEMIEEVDSFQYLGITLDKWFKYRLHLDNLEKKLSSAAGIFRRISKYLNDFTRRAIFFSLFHSHLSYGIEIWGSANKTRIATLQTIQNKAIKNLYQLDRREPTKKMHENRNLLPVNFVHLHKILNITHNIMSHQIHTNTIFLINSELHEYKTRTSKHLHISVIHPASIKYISIINYNKLTDTLKQTPFQTKISLNLSH